MIVLRTFDRDGHFCLCPHSCVLTIDDDCAREHGFFLGMTTSWIDALSEP